MIACVVDVTPGSTSVTLGPITTVNGGSARTTGLGVSVTVLTPWRVVLSYHDGGGQPVVTDAAVFGTSVVVGRCGD